MKPIVSLYRNILREHRRLPIEMRRLGNEYVRNEFHLHKSAKPSFVVSFTKGWEDYLSKIRQQNSDFGYDLQEKDISVLSEAQKIKLEEMKKGSRGD